MSGQKYKYIYGIIRSSGRKHRDFPGLNGDAQRIYTIPCRDLAMVVGDCDEPFISPIKTNLFCHEKIISAIMAEETIIPMSFGYVLDSENQAYDFLEKNYTQLEKVLSRLDNKVELALGVYWQKETFRRDILEGNEHRIRHVQDTAAGSSPCRAYPAKIELDKVVADLVEEKRNYYLEKIFDPLLHFSVDVRYHAILNELMIGNAAYLIEKNREHLFDDEVRKFYEKLKHKLIFKYSGPWAPYNFVNLQFA